jgi:hypothetical protein
MIRVAPALFPDTHIRVVTNGNFDFQTYMVTSGISGDYLLHRWSRSGHLRSLPCRRQL